MIENPIRMLQQVIIADPYDGIAKPFKVRRATRILCELLIVLRAVQFDN